MRPRRVRRQAGNGAPSTRRRKKEIEDLGERSRALRDLRPVTFRYLEDPSSDELPKRWGLIAEEVAEVLPELIHFDHEDLPAGVRYHQLIPLLLNELIRLEEEVGDLRSELDRLRAPAR